MKIVTLLEELRDYQIKKYETDSYFKKQLDRLIVKKYHGDFSTFIQDEVLNEDYGNLRAEVERIYNH